MELKDYYFNLPQNLIAQVPAHPRDHARLLIYNSGDKSLTDAYFYNLPKFLPASSCIVLNNSKVEHCRWLFDEGNTELFIVDKVDAHTVRALVRPGRKFQFGSRFHITNWLSLEVKAIDHDGIRTIRLNIPHDDERLKAYEHVPLPPYITQNDGLSSEYQTVYANPPGSLAAPTAGLHFTTSLLEKIREKWPVAEITLHVGLGTFAKVTDMNLREGKLHEEWFRIDEKAVNILNSADNRIAIGTTSLRALETAATRSGQVRPTVSKTEIFIRPGYKFRATHGLITNFHLPGTSLLMLVAAFIADKQNISEAAAIRELKRIYKHAIDCHYRFYSFGDAMMIM